MNAFHALFLGVLQGLTEFLPVSSSGHLVLAERFLSLQLDGRDLLIFNVILHAGTALALILCYRRRWLAIIIWKDAEHRRLLQLLIIATIPGAIAGLLFEDLISVHLQTIPSIAIAFFLTAVLLLIAPRYRGSGSLHRLRFDQALVIGCAQALAIIPGLSRSGWTISAGKMSGLSREEALDFSFLLALPIILGATLVAALSIAHETVSLPAPTFLLTGFLSSFVVSAGAIVTLKKFVQNHSLAWFAAYLLPLSAILLLLEAIKWHV